ncbi:MAG TPA: hypothetical protein PL074_06345, partial [Thermoflexales bacterium]|nr:hypothetical protein [Thermoflexales bacterium]
MFASFALTSLTILSACGAASTPAASSSASNVASVPYTEAKNYFVNNNVKPGWLTNVKIENQADFDAMFGMGATQASKPTAIDFSKQYVIGVVGDVTDVNTEITPVSLSKDASGKIVFAYKIKTGEKMTYTMRPISSIQRSVTTSGLGTNLPSTTSAGTTDVSNPSRIAIGA